MFTKFSVTKAVKGMGHGLVAKSDKFEVYATRTRGGVEGQRYYHITFSVVRVLSTEPRKIESIELPPTCQSSLEKVLAHLEKMS